MKILCALLLLAAPQAQPTEAGSALTPAVSGSATAVAVIEQPGSYRLARNLRGPAGLNGIEVRSGGVTLDLGGHALIGSPGSLDGILVAPGMTDVRILGGTIRGWGGDGIDAFGLLVAGGTVDAVIVERLVVEACGGDGMRLGGAAVVSSCVLRTCAGNGIEADFGATVRDTVAKQCGGTGIKVDQNSSVTSSVASGNGQLGIEAGFGSTVEGCAASSNLLGIAVTSGTIRGCSASFNDDAGFSANNPASVVIACTADSNGADGFFIGSGVVVADCSATRNGGAGIAAKDSSSIRDCNASFNGAAGISTGDASTVQGCVTNGNAFGVQTQDECSVIDCTAEGNLANGIRVGSDCLVRGNNVSDNVGSGIIAVGNENRIDSNHATEDDITLEPAGNNTLIRNSADDYNLNPGASGFLAPIRFTPVGVGPYDNIEF